MTSTHNSAMISHDDGMSIARPILFLLTIVVWCMGSVGCSLPSESRRWADASDIAVAVEGVGEQPRGGLPDKVRLTVRNTSTASLLFALPRPLIDEKTSSLAKGPLVTVGLALTDKEGHSHGAIYAHPEAKAPEALSTVTLPPAGTWTSDYPLKEFYFWGPCGPDTGGDFTRYFRKGGKELELNAQLVWVVNDTRVVSGPIRLRLEHEAWLFTR